MTKHLLILTWMLLGVSLAQQPTAPKPPLGIPADAKLFNGKWYAVILDKADWPTAQSRCKQKGGQLACVHDKATSDFIISLTKLRVWLGATDEQVDGKWIWSDGKEMTFTNWSKGQPDNKEGKEMFLRAGGDGLWADHPKQWDAYASFSVVGYICEWKARLEGKIAAP